MSEVGSEWIRCTLGELSETSSGGTPNRSDPLAYGGDIPWVKSGEVASSDIWDTDERITSYGLDMSAAKLVSEGSLLMAMYGATAGQVARLKIPAATNQAVLAIRPHSDTCDADFLYHCLVRSKDELLLACQGSGQPNLNAGIVKGLKIDVPPLPEQQKIAEILSGIDKEIYALSTLISLLALGKRNLLHDAAAKEPDQFSVKALGDIASVINGYAFSSSDLEDSSDGIPVIRMSNLKGGAVQYDSALKIQESKASGLERFLLKKGDLLIGMSGSISNTALVTSEKAALLNQRVGALRANDEGGFYHAIAYQSEIAMRQVERMAAGGAQLNISSSQIESVEIPVPSQREIDKITHCWFSMENMIRLYEIKLGRLRSLKSALASDLLSGRKRVSI